MIDYFWYICEVIYLFIRWFLRNFKSGYSDSVECLAGKTAIVTGGSQGIGYEISLLLASRGCNVIIACRSDATEAKEKIIELTKNPNIQVRKLDLSSLKSVRSFAENIVKTEAKIDILINNAGIGASRETLTEDGLGTTMQTNYFGPFYLTHLLIGPMKKASTGARITFTGSGFGLLGKATVNNLNSDTPKDSLWTLLGEYNKSKFCNILLAQEFGRRLEKCGITAYCADTGVGRTKIFREFFYAYGYFTIIQIIYQALISCILREPRNAAQSTFHLATSEKLKGQNGKLFFRCKPFPKPNVLKNRKYCDELWRKTEELVNLTPEEKI